ncbi:MAG: hydroxysqualene dehydroxylase HpnE, partial [Ignavibacteria bacterium]
FLTQRNFKVTLIEASPKLGGRAYSFFDNAIDGFIDNGQHILASWYENTLEFLKIIGTLDKLNFQKTLEVKFADLKRNRYHFKCPRLIPPLHLIAGILKYNALRFKDKLGIVRIFTNILFSNFSDDNLKQMTAEEYFTKTGQSKRIVDYFWKPFIVAVFNAEPDETSAWHFVNIIKKGFLRKNGSNLILPKSNLNETYVNDCIEYLKKNNTEVLTSTRVKNLVFKADKVESLLTDDRRELKFDYYLSAVPFFDFKNLIGENFYNKDYSYVDELTYSPIINIHHQYVIPVPAKAGNAGIKKEDFNFDFIGILNATIQWVFKVNTNQICIVISSAKNIVDMDKDDLIELSKKELIQCLPEFGNVQFTGSRVVKEKRATFLPDARSINSRPEHTTRFKNFFILGDWTNTGYPSTIESAVLSSKNCVAILLKGII